MSKVDWGWRLPPGCSEPPDPDEEDKVEEIDPEDNPFFWDRYEEYLEKRKYGRA